MKSIFDIIDNPPEVYEYVPPAKVRQLTHEQLIGAAFEASKVLGRLVKDPDASQSQIRACQVVLDRAGFGPHQSMTIDDTASLAVVESSTSDQLEHRALLLANLAKKFRHAEEIAAAASAAVRMNDDDVHPSPSDDDDESSLSSVH